jgi:hypothetical protein
MRQPLVPISLGELLDKISILEIKVDEITDPAKVANITRELRALEAIQQAEIIQLPEIHGLYASLQQVNRQLWKIEDEIRAKERAKVYDSTFIQLARSVYINNDVRAQLKRRINEIAGSDLIEEKSYI